MKNTIKILLGTMFLCWQYASGQTEPQDSTITLGEVVVSGYIPQVKTEGPISTVKVRGTLLSKMGNAATILANMPGLHKGASGIEVNGLGKPIFLLNGREIDPDKVLEMLQANTIKEVKINRMPDISYSADGRCTVEIITFKQPDDFLSLSVGDDIFVRRKFSDAGNFNAGIQTPKVTSTLNYTGGVVQFQNRETYFREVYHGNFVSSFDQQRKTNTKETPHRLRFATDYDINKYHRIGFEYFYQHSSNTSDESGVDSYENDNKVIIGNLARQQHKLSNVHNLTLQYNYKQKGKTFQFVQDLTANTSRSNVKSSDFIGISPIDTYSHNRYRMSTTNVKFTTILPGKISMATGGKYIYIDNKGYTASDASNINSNGYKHNYEIIEHNPQVFVSLSRKFGRLGINTGVRYQYLHRNIVTPGSNGYNSTVSRNTSSFFPLVSVTYKYENGNSLFFRYNRTVERPNFNAINSGMTYIDSLTYSTGNPSLESSYSDIITAGYNWKDFTFSTRFTHESDPIIGISEIMEAGSDIAVERYINFGNVNDLRFSVSYSKTIRKLNLYSEVEVCIPHGKYTFLDKEYASDKISFNCNINVNYPITPKIGIFSSFNYQGSREYLTLYQKDVNNLSVGFVVSLLKNRLIINAAFTDILHGSNYNNLTYRYGNIANGTYGTNDQRGFMLKISYALFTKKIKSKTQHDNNETINRTL